MAEKIEMSDPEREMSDPMEDLVAAALSETPIAWTREGDPDHPPGALDFYLPFLDVHIEVKRLHSERVAGQMARHDNVIVAQGEGAVRLLAKMIRDASAFYGERAMTGAA